MEAHKFQFKDSYFKILSYVVGGLLTLYVLTSRTVTDAILNFCFAGIVPGTDIVLDPQTVLIAQTLMAGLFVALVLIAYLYRKITYRRAMASGMVLIPPETKDQAIKKSAPKQDYTLVYKRPASEVYTGNVSQLAVPVGTMSSRTVPSSVVKKRSHLSNIIFHKEIFALATLPTRVFVKILRRIITAVYSGLLKSIRHTAKMLQEIVIKTFVLIWIVYDTLRATTIAAWTWIRPYAERFDTWLELHYRRSTSALGTLLMRYERVQVSVAIVRQGSQAIRHLFK